MLYYTILYYTIPDCTILDYTILYYSILYYSLVQFRLAPQGESHRRGAYQTRREDAESEKAAAVLVLASYVML